MGYKRIVQVLIVVFSVVFLNDIVLAELNVQLTVTDYAGIDRSSEPVTSGIPLPESADIKSVDQLALYDSSGNPVPVQFTVLSRWHGKPDDDTKPIKWVLLDFQADVPQGGSTVYYLREGSAVTPSEPISISQDDEKIIVETGKAKFQISKKYFNLFDYVWIDADGDGEVDDLVLSQGGEGGLVLVDDKGKRYYTRLEAPEEVEVEQQGPMRAVVHIRGVFKAEDGSYFAPSICGSEEYPRFCQTQFYPHSFVYYNIRIYFYSNKDYVRVFFTLENNGANGRTNPEQYYAPIQAVYFDSVNLILKPNGFVSTHLATEDANVSLVSGDKFVLYQDWKENLTDNNKDTLEPLFDKGIYYFTQKNGEKLSEGKTNPGWIDVNNGSVGIGLAIRYFWQNFPKKITVTPSEIKIGFWPEEGYYPYCQSSDFPDAKYDMYCRKAGRDAGVYLFDAGRHKTYEFFLRFYAGNQDVTTQNLSKAIKEPLMALAPPEWYAETKALGMIAPAGLTSTDEELNEALQRFERLQRALVYEEDSDNGWTILNIKTADPPHWEFTKQNRFWGWMNFGDLLWSSQAPCALHYDWPYSMLLHYIRTGKRKFFDVGAEMAKHRYDIDQYHGDRVDDSGNYKYINHFQFYETSGHADPNLNQYYPSRIAPPTHTWNGGIILYYLLTGDRLALEAAEENGKAVLNYYAEYGIYHADRPSCTKDEIRYEGWSILNLINLYRVTGDQEYLEVAKNIAKNRLLYTEQEQGGNGYWGISLSSAGECSDIGGCNLCNDYQWSTMYIYVLEGLINIHYETHDEDIKNLLIRMADFCKDYFLYGGFYNDNGQYMPLQTQYKWDRNNPSGGEPVKSVWFTDLFAYVYQLTGNSEYLAFARKCFRDGIFYYTATGNTFIDPSYRSPISYLEGQYPNSHTKVHGWLGRTCQVYLYTEWILQQGELKLITTVLPKGAINANYDYIISAAGGEVPYKFSITSGSLPKGITLDTNTGKLSGVPVESGTFQFTVTVIDNKGSTSSRLLTLEISAPSSLTISTISLPVGYVGQEYNVTVLASGGTSPYQWSLIGGELPKGLSFSNGIISGTPEEVGTFCFTIKVSDSSGCSVSRDFSLEIRGEENSHDQDNVVIAGGIQKDNNQSKSGCFIATAAYGTPMAKEIKYLCKFRDEYLLPNKYGRKFVMFYYKYSPPIANYIAKHEKLRAVVRFFLKPLVWISKKLTN